MENYMREFSYSKNESFRRQWKTQMIWNVVENDIQIGYGYIVECLLFR